MKDDHVRKLMSVAVAAVLLVLLGPSAAGPGPSVHAASGNNRIVGAAKCKSCHRSDSTGNQFGKWESVRHSRAFGTLATERAKELGAERGVEAPDTADECVRCHRTGHGLPETAFKRGFEFEDGVQCESCHGPGEEHVKARLMAAAKGDTTNVEPGEILARPTEEQCRECHNPESPSFKHFCFVCRSAKIRHLNPKRHTDEELAAMEKAAREACDCEADCGAEVCRY